MSENFYKKNILKKVVKSLENKKCRRTFDTIKQEIIIKRKKRRTMTKREAENKVKQLEERIQELAKAILTAKRDYKKSFEAQIVELKAQKSQYIFGLSRNAYKDE